MTGSAEASAGTLVAYRLDAEDRIVDVEGDWSPVPGVVGSLIWRFVRGTDLQDIYRRLFRAARAGRPLEFPYRCDSPSARREFSLAIERRADGTLAVASRLCRVWERDELLAVTSVPRNDTLVLRCSVCNDFRVRGEWADIVDAAAARRLLATERPVRVYHAVCPSCRARLRAV